MLLVVAYDVTDDRRRARLHTFLLSYGVAVQESVFECEADAPQERALKRGVARIARARADKVHFYRLCAECAAVTAELTGPRPASPLVYVV
ncbi:MAG: CRISPR-associated endonuclease Cas2 [Thermomicrobiales bacterium]